MDQGLWSFHKIGDGGIGNPRSRVAHASAMFEDRLYLGVTHPNAESPEDCARVLCYRFETCNWEEVHRSPLVEADPRQFAQDVLRPKARRRVTHHWLPRERGFRGMTVFQGASDRKPCLYVSTISNLGFLLLRSEDGERFEVVSEPGLGDDRLLSCRTLVPFAGKLFTTPIGGVSDGVLDRNNTVRPTVFVSEDPATGIWHEAGPEGMGDPRNAVIFQMATLGDWLYAGTGNPERGFELWKTDAVGLPPYRWHRVLEQGAFRFNLNESAASMVAFQGALYVGTGLPGLGYDRANDVGPAAAELIRVFPDDRWEVVVGEPRFSPIGLQIPLSAMAPGFNDYHNSVIWRMAVYDETLFVGTHHWGVYDYLLGRDDVPSGGYHIWASRDGETWSPLTLDGFGDPFAVGVRTLLPTSHGIVVGTDDHGLLRERAARTRGYKGVGGDRSGCTVWLLADRDRSEPPVLGGYG